MQLTFVDPGADYMVDSVMLFQEEGETPYWSEALYYYYPEIDKGKALSLPFEGRKAYVAAVWNLAQPIIEKLPQIGG